MGFESALLIARGEWVNLNKLTVKTMSFPCAHFVLRHFAFTDVLLMSELGIIQKFPRVSLVAEERFLRGKLRAKWPETC